MITVTKILIQPTTVKAIIVAIKVIGLIITDAVANQSIRYSITSHITVTQTIRAAIEVDTSSTTVSSIKLTVIVICFIVAVAISNLRMIPSFTSFKMLTSIEATIICATIATVIVAGQGICFIIAISVSN